METSATIDVAQEHDRVAQDDHAPHLSPAVMHGFAAKVERAVAKLSPIRRHIDQAGVATGAGAGTLTFEGPKQGFVWQIERAFIDGTGGTAGLYVGKVQASNLKDFTLSANKSSLDNASPIYVPSNNEINIVFAGTPAAALLQVNLQIRELPLD